MFKHHYDGAWVQAELPAAVQEYKPALSQTASGKKMSFMSL